MRGRLTQALLDVSRRAIHRNFFRDEVNILIISHGPTGASAALEPDSMPGMRFCDTVHYTIEIADGIYTIVASEHIPAPDHDTSL